jgi:hypothetical protein
MAGDSDISNRPALLYFVPQATACQVTAINNLYMHTYCSSQLIKRQHMEFFFFNG